MLYRLVHTHLLLWFQLIKLQISTFKINLSPEYLPSTSKSQRLFGESFTTKPHKYFRQLKFSKSQTHLIICASTQIHLTLVVCISTSGITIHLLLQEVTMGVLLVLRVSYFSPSKDSQSLNMNPKSTSFSLSLSSPSMAFTLIPFSSSLRDNFPISISVVSNTFFTV